MPTVSTRISYDTLAKLQEQARRNKRSVSSFVCKVLTAVLEVDPEDQQTVNRVDQKTGHEVGRISPEDLNLPRPVPERMQDPAQRCAEQSEACNLLDDSCSGGVIILVDESPTGCGQWRHSGTPSPK